MQVAVEWIGPSRTEECDTIDAVVPPPLPIQTINITRKDRFNVEQLTPETYRVSVSVR